MFAIPLAILGSLGHISIAKPYANNTALLSTILLPILIAISSRVFPVEITLPGLDCPGIISYWPLLTISTHLMFKYG